MTPEYGAFLDQFIHLSQTIYFKNSDISLGEKITSNKCLSQDIFIELLNLLDAHTEYFDTIDFFVIEEQMSFMGKNNVTAQKISQFIYSYFVIKYKDTKKIVVFPAYNKTQMLGCPPGLTKPQRKKWIVEKAKEIWTIRGDIESVEALEKNKKADDISDTLGLNLTYMITLL